MPVTVVVTEVVEVEGEAEIVTRIITETITITATPEPELDTAVLAPPVELDLGYVAVLPQLDPQLNNSAVGLDLLQNLYIGLTNYNHETNQVEPEFAQRWEVSPNGRVWTFYLRDDIYWVKPTVDPPAQENETWSASKHRQVTAEDLVFAIRRACTQETSAPDTFILFIIEGCEYLHSLAEPKPNDSINIGVQALDEFTVQFSLAKPAAQFLTMTTLPIFHPIPKDLINDEEIDWLLPENLLTSGPFMPIPSGLSDTRVVLHRNSEWPLFSTGNVDIVNILFLDNENALYELWEDKSIELSSLPVNLEESFLETTPQKAKLILEQTVFYLGFNFESGVFREPAMRRAFSAAIDREQLVEVILGEAGVPMRHLTPPNSVGAPPVAEVGLGFSPDFARQEMVDSGFGSCRLMPPIRFLISSSDISLQRAEILRDMWADVLNCPQEQIVIEQAQFGVLLANTRTEAGAGRPDMWELGWASYYPDAFNWTGDLLHCTESENRQDRPCTDVDDVIRTTTSTVDPDARMALFREAELLFFARDGLHPIVPLYAPGQFIVVQSWLEFVPASFGGEQFDRYEIDATLKELERSR